MNFDGLWLERAALTSLVVMPGQVPLVTSSVQGVWLRICFTPRSSLEMLANTGFVFVGYDAGVGLIVSEAFNHPPHLTHSFRL